MSYEVRMLTNPEVPNLRPVLLEAFSDYAVPMQMSHEKYMQKFVHKLGIETDLSPVVAHDGESVGFIFTAVDDYRGVLSAYNGGTGVLPQHRGQKLVDQMYEAMIPKLQAQGVKQSVLEVIADNLPAQGAYSRVGFEKGDFLRCFKLTELPDPYSRTLPGLMIEPERTPDWDQLKEWSTAEATFLDMWSRVPYNPFEETLVAKDVDEVVLGAATYQPNLGRISAIVVNPTARGRGIGSALVAQMVKRSAQPNLTLINVRDQDQGIITWLGKLGFENGINQYEMTLSIDD